MLINVMLNVSKLIVILLSVDKLSVFMKYVVMRIVVILYDRMLSAFALTVVMLNNIMLIRKDLFPE
jgi:hypothetical protein